MISLVRDKLRVCPTVPCVVSSGAWIQGEGTRRQALVASVLINDAVVAVGR